MERRYGEDAQILYFDIQDETVKRENAKLLDEIETEGLEMRINARAVMVLPWLVLVALTARLMAWPLEKAVYLAPVIVVGGAAAVGLAILWGKVAWNSLQESRRPRLVLALWLLGLALLVVLTVLGVRLPREG